MQLGVSWGSPEVAIDGQVAFGMDKRPGALGGSAEFQVKPQLPGLDEQDDGREILGDAKAVLGPTIAGPPERVSERLAADADKCRSRCPASSGSPTSPTCSRTGGPGPRPGLDMTHRAGAPLIPQSPGRSMKSGRAGSTVFRNLTSCQVLFTVS